MLLFRLMEDLYRNQYHSSISSSYDDLTMRGLDHDNLIQLKSAEIELRGSDMYDQIKCQISNHPLYPNLLSAYIDSQKIGAPPEMTSFLDEISTESLPIDSRIEIGIDPELDEFMESYCEVLQRYKEELSKPFDEATTFLSNIESQLGNLCKETLTPTATGNYQSDDGAGSLVEDLSCGEVGASESQESSGGRPHQEIKEMLLRKYSSYLSSLRKDFLEKRKKGKLPKEARSALLEWWNTHCRWPYPMEEEKRKLSEVTGLDQKQINNWFINQRKRHWKPSEDMRFAVLENVSGSIDIYNDNN